ncbi:hypothetical protein TNCV_488671 [Trichonephila clavipes]|nr:hypothetical protein TNCV_488671 [Trichonephila clavipes]
MGLTFDDPARASSVARGNENPDVGLACKAFPPNSDNILQKLREFLKYEILVSHPYRRNRRQLPLPPSLRVQFH